MLDVTLVDDGRRNVKIELEFWKQNSQFFAVFIILPLVFLCIKYLLGLKKVSFEGGGFGGLAAGGGEISSDLYRVLQCDI